MIMIPRGKVWVPELMGKEKLYRIRKFKWADIERVLEIEARAYPKTSLPKDAFRDFARRLPETFIVIEAGEGMAGYMVFDLTGHVQSTAVGPEFRKRGFGRLLFEHAAGISPRDLWLEVRSKNRGAISFYRRLGMRVIGRIPAYYGDDDALVMASPGDGRA